MCWVKTLEAAGKREVLGTRGRDLLRDGDECVRGFSGPCKLQARVTNGPAIRKRERMPQKDAMAPRFPGHDSDGDHMGVLRQCVENQW